MAKLLHHITLILLLFFLSLSIASSSPTTTFNPSPIANNTFSSSSAPTPPSPGLLRNSYNYVTLKISLLLRETVITYHYLLASRHHRRTTSLHQTQNLEPGFQAKGIAWLWNSPAIAAEASTELAVRAPPPPGDDNDARRRRKAVVASKVGVKVEEIPAIAFWLDDLVVLLEMIPVRDPVAPVWEWVFWALEKICL
ncbi:MAG: hypothetical protein Q9222_007732, partial [Ikaeria aurantiellina]